MVKKFQLVKEAQIARLSLSQQTNDGPYKKDFYNEAITVGEVAFAVLNREPKKIIQIHDVTGETMTCGELLQNSQKLCRHLLLMGLLAKDRIGLLSSNHTHVITVMMASFLCGTPVIAPSFGIDPEAENENVPLIFDSTRPKVIFCDIENLALAQMVHKKLQLTTPIIVLNGNGDNCRNIMDLLNTELPDGNKKKFRYPCMDLHGDDPAMMLCTSGTTGPPKTLFVSSRVLLNMQAFSTLKSDSVVLSFSPMYWVSGLWAVIASLAQGCLRIITTRPASGEYFVELLQRYNISHVLAHATLLIEALALEKDKLRQAFDHLDTIIAGGSKIPLIVQQKVNALMASNIQRPGLGIAYGLSEFGGILTYNTHYLAEYRQGTEGCLMANTKVRILSPTGERLGPNEPGRVCLHSPYAWQGYYKNPKATAETLDADNWLLTSDIGYMDENGYFHYLCRVIDYFESNNCPIYPQVLEDVILEIPGVLEVCVFRQEDSDIQNRVACAIVRCNNHDGEKLKGQDIVAYVKENISKEYHLSGDVHFVEKIPKNGSGKMQRHKIKKRFSQ